MNLSTILLLGSVQAAFLVLLILSKRGKTLPDAVLATWVGLLGTHHLIFVLFSRGLLSPSVWLNVNAGVPLLQGPFLYVYVQTLTSGRRRLRMTNLLHGIPFLLFVIYMLWGLPRVDHGGSGHVSVFRLSRLLTTTILVSVPVYAVTSLRLLRRHRRRTLTRHSEIRGRDLSWLRWIVLALLGVWCVVIAVVVLETVAPGSAYGSRWHPMMSAVTLFIYVIGYFGFRQIAVGEPPELIEPAPSATPELLRPLAPLESSPAPDPSIPKYARSGLRDDATNALVDRLMHYLDEQRVHLEEGVTLREVAAGVGISPNHLSQVINQGLGKNFYELINERRVEEFKRRAVDPENRSFTLLAIALDSGFSSKSSFNRVFKQFTGMSPKQFVDRHASSDE